MFFIVRVFLHSIALSGIGANVALAMPPQEPCAGLYAGIRDRQAIDRPSAPVAGMVSWLRNLPEGESEEAVKVHLRISNADTSLSPVPTRIVKDSMFPYPEFLGEKWSFGDSSYRFVNAGSRQIQRDAPLIDHVVRDAIATAPGRDIELRLGSKWVFGKDTLDSWQGRGSFKATEVYRSRKNYLSSAELIDMRADDVIHKNNNDYLFLLRDPQKDPLSMSPREFDDNVQMMVRLARMTDLDPEYPIRFNVRDAFRDSLPHSDRVEEAKRLEVLRRLDDYQASGGKRVAEISRFVKFQDVPAPVQSAFLLRLFLLARNPEAPIDRFVISVDRVTRRLFGPRYRFKDFDVIRSENGDPQEFLMYLDTESEEFETTVSELKANSAGLTSRSVLVAPPPSEWAKPWGLPSPFFGGPR